MENQIHLVIILFSCRVTAILADPEPPNWTPKENTFECTMYDSWGTNTYTVPVGDFCSRKTIPPTKPKCAKSTDVEAPNIYVYDGEGTDCTIQMYNSPDETTNADCLTAITTEISGKDETWLVFISHGFTGSVDSDWLSPLRESILERYRTSTRRIIGAIVDWGDVSTRIRPWLGNFPIVYPNICHTGILTFGIVNYPRAAVTTMVIGHLLATLTKRVEPDIAGTFKTYCIGHSLGSHVCGFAGKDYRTDISPGSPLMEGIVAIDPAGPVFLDNNELKLDSGDAKAVQALHTNSKGPFPLAFGYQPTLGDVDFYLNGAKKQPGCSQPDLEACSHGFGYLLLTWLNEQNVAGSGTTYQCLSTSGLIVGDLEHLADTPSTDMEELLTGEVGTWGCDNNVVT